MEEIEKQFVPIDVAFAAKERGFDQPCFCYHTEINGGEFVKFYFPAGPGRVEESMRALELPTYHQLIDFFEKKGVIILVQFIMGPNNYRYWICDTKKLGPLGLPQERGAIIADFDDEYSSKNKYEVYDKAFEIAFKLIDDDKEKD